MAELTVEEKKKKKRIVVIVLIIVFLLIASAVGYYFYNRSKENKTLKEAGDKAKLDKDKAKPADETPSHQSEPRPKSPAAKGDAFPLEKGSKGDNVKYLQRALNRMVPKGYTSLKEDGDFGQNTYLAVVTWIGSSYYPVTQENWMKIMEKANSYMKK